MSGFEVKSKREKIFKKHNLPEEYSVKIYKLIIIFINIMKKVQVDKNSYKHILFGIDVYFNKFFLAVEIDEIGHTG